jgi:acetylornithine deacetylase/succinyl-diaminopimelate desuccinylase
MKGALAAMAVALVALRRSGTLSAGRLTLAAVVDEEMQSLGAEDLVRRGFQADGAIVGEPTDNRICIGHKGLEWLEVRFAGRAAHGGTPQAGINAIVAAARFIRLLEERLGPRLRSRAHPILGEPTVAVGTIHGGDQPSTVAASCVLTLDRRSLPGENYTSITAELRELLDCVEAELPGLRTTLGRMPGGMATLEHVGFATPADHPLVQAAQTACAGAGMSGELCAFPAWTDGALLSGFGGIPSLVLGPGSLALAHSPYEWVALDEVTQAARLYAALALDFCAGVG